MDPTPRQEIPHQTSEVNFVSGIRILFIGISSATGAGFATLAGLSISAIAVPVRRFHAFSIVIAAVAVCLAYLAFRAALSGQIDEEAVAASLRNGVVGAFVGMIVIVALLLMFSPGIQGFLAHALGKRASSFTTYRLLATSLLMGFGAGFVVRIPKTVA
jgi:hypothetical protein